MSRTERVANLIRKEISDILRKEISDPRIGFVSITDVEIPPDLKTARIHVSVMGDDKKKNEAIKGLQSATKRIRYKLSPRLDLKSIPELEFRLDESIERGDRILNLMNKIGKEKK